MSFAYVRLKHTVLLVALCFGAAFTGLHGDEPKAVTPAKKALWDAMLTSLPRQAPSVPVKTLPPRQVATLFSEPVMSDDPQTVNGKILGALLEKYVKERGITVSDEEMALLAQRFKEGEKHREKQRAEYIEELKEALASGTLSEEQSSLARRRLEGAERRRTQNPDNELSAEDQLRIQNQIYRPLVLHFKTKQQLYRDYGGRVVYQQMGPEPLDAMHDFLKAEQAKGSFSFNDAEAEAAFWAYFTTTPHTYVRDEKEASDMMQSPWWLKPLPTEDSE